jgi:hypothetical protein
MEKGYDFWLCHTIKKTDGTDTVVDCHIKYHVNFFESTGSATGSSVASGLTDEAGSPLNLFFRNVSRRCAMAQNSLKY